MTIELKTDKPITLKTVLTFEQEIPPAKDVEVRLSSVRVYRDGKWVGLPVSEVGLFHAHKLETKCDEFILKQIWIDTCAGGRTPPGKYMQFPASVGIAVEVFIPSPLNGGMRFDTCFPEHITFIVTNRTDAPRKFSMELSGVSLPEWSSRRGR